MKKQNKNKKKKKKKEDSTRNSLKNHIKQFKKLCHLFQSSYFPFFSELFFIQIYVAVVLHEERGWVANCYNFMRYTT